MKSHPDTGLLQFSTNKVSRRDSEFLREDSLTMIIDFVTVLDSYQFELDWSGRQGRIIKAKVKEGLL